MSRHAKADLADYDDYEEADEYPEARATTTRKRNWRSYDEDYGPPASASRGGGGGGTGGIFKSAAIEVLNQEKRLMATGEITRLALDRKLLHCQGKTPDATMASALYTDVRKRGGSSPFIKPKQGLFGLKAWLDEPWLQDWLHKEGIDLGDFLPDENAEYESHGGGGGGGSSRSNKSARKGNATSASGQRSSRRNTSRINYAAYEGFGEEEEEAEPEEEEEYAEGEEEYAEEGAGGSHAHTAYTEAYRHANTVGNLAYQSTYAATAGTSRTAAASAASTAAASTAAAGSTAAGSTATGKAGTSGTGYTYTAGRQPLALPNNIYSQANLPAALYNMQNLQAAAALAAVSQRNQGGTTGTTGRSAVYYYGTGSTAGQQ